MANFIIVRRKAFGNIKLEERTLVNVDRIAYIYSDEHASYIHFSELEDAYISVHDTLESLEIAIGVPTDR